MCTPLWRGTMAVYRFLASAPFLFRLFTCTIRSKRVDRCVGVEHEEYLEAVDLTLCVGTIPTWLASYFLV